MSIMHNGEKVLNNLTTVPITQTINASSTETEIPSAKAVNTLLNNKADKMAMLTSQNIDDLVNEGSYYIIAATNAPDAYGWVDVLANNDYTIQLFYPSITTNCEMYIRRRREGVWGQWQRLCTTRVANSSGTVTLPDNITGTISYKVINGVCYVSIQGLADGLTGGDVATFTGLPKPDMYVNIGIENAGYRIGTIYTDDAATFHVHKTTTGSGFCSFSYPVAES